MPRPPRLLLSKSFYHVMARGNNRHTIFTGSEDYEYYLSLLDKYKSEHPFDLYHYCLMPNHVHLQIQTQNAPSFATFMKRLSLAYFHYYKKHYGWVGHFWQGRYKSQPVGKDAYFIQCGKYIELNPVRAGLVQKPEQYPYSSYRYYSHGERKPFTTEDLFYNGLGQTQAQRMKNYQDLVVSEMVTASYKKTTWGSVGQRRNEGKKIKYNLDRLI